MNSELYGQEIVIPDEVINHLTICFENVPSSNSNTEGHNRNQELRDTGYVTYQQLGRMKNWFDSFQGKKEDAPYVLNGGDYMYNWVNNTLQSLRNGTNLQTKIDKEYQPEDISDELITDMGWLSNMNRPSKEHSSEIDDLKITESVKRINQIIKKII